MILKWLIPLSFERVQAHDACKHVSTRIDSIEKQITFRYATSSSACEPPLRETNDRLSMIDVKRQTISPILFHVDPSTLINDSGNRRRILAFISDKSCRPTIFDGAPSQLLAEINGTRVQFIVRYARRPWIPNRGAEQAESKLVCAQLCRETVHG